MSDSRTQPERRRPLVPGPVETAVMFWRWLRRMRTALYLLGVLGVATLLATLVPQRPNVASTVARWEAGTEGPGAFWAGLLDALGLFDVFGSVWFAVLLLLLFTSLTSCLLPRYRAFWRMWRRGRPPRSRDLAAHPHVVRLRTDRTPDEALTAARELLRRRWRVRSDEDDPAGPAPVRSDMRGVVVPAPADADAASDTATSRPPGTQVAAERGHLLREGGSLAFHSAFYLLLIGVVAGQLLGFSGQVGVNEGEAFADTPVAYWSSEPGRLWDAGDHRGFTLRLEEFRVDWTDAAQPVEFVSTVSVTPADGREPITREIRVNDPMVVDGMKIHLLDWGYAARMVVREDGVAVYEGTVPLTPAGGNVWEGAVKAPGADPQLGLELALFPTAVEGPDGRLVPSSWPGAEAPLILFNAWRGDLQLDRVQGFNELQTAGMRPITTTGLRPGTGVDLGDGVTVEFTDLRRWAGFQVSRRPTAPLLLLAAGLVLVGLLPALYAYRRRIWIDAVPHPTATGTLVTIAGQAFQRPHAFESEHEAIVLALGRQLDARPEDGSARPADGSSDRAADVPDASHEQPEVVRR